MNIFMGKPSAGTSGRQQDNNNGINCPHCKERILILVTNSKTKKKNCCPCCEEQLILNKK